MINLLPIKWQLVEIVSFTSINPKRGKLTLAASEEDSFTSPGLSDKANAAKTLRAHSREQPLPTCGLMAAFQPLIKQG